ncbi:MAG: hypothetical protein PHN84_08750 [Desulfuromonadaceae bacterium]|nr:hypothetical protein [Desulfuromonadaceae bacterium]MDD2855483.1 hypothetical protein [Desulfuromonadaceae bacterium]
MESGSFYDARGCYEDGLNLCSSRDEYADIKSTFIKNIDNANYKLAQLNIEEAEYAYSRGDSDRAIDHLELVKTLTYDVVLRENAERLLESYRGAEESTEVLIPTSSCTSCSASHTGGGGSDTYSEELLPLMEYYELLIQQLPNDQYDRYSQLGEEFAYAYAAASRDEHEEALAGFEKCLAHTPEDIYCYEKGKLLHRLGDDGEAELNFRASIKLNNENSLAWLALALLLFDHNRFQEALKVVELMIVDGIMPEYALLLRAEIYEMTKDYETAVNQYAELLHTGYARTAAEKLYGLLHEMGRYEDAAVILKKYLKKSCH